MPTSSRIHPRYLGRVFACASAAALLCAGPAFAGPTVTVRVEGETATLLPATKVTLSAPEPVSGCPANSAAAAINLAVGGKWDHGGSSGNFTETILGETHSFTHESDAWTEWVNYKLGHGICSDLLSEGDEVLMVADHEPGPSYAPTVLPLVVTGAPATVQAGTAFTVKVSAVHTPPEPEPGAGAPEPAEGVTVSGAGVSAVTGPGGVATLTLASPGQATLRATKAGDAPSSTFTVCVHNGNDGNCGTPSPRGSAGPVALGAPPVTVAAPYVGPFALVPAVSGLTDGHVYPHGAGPRLLSGTVHSHNAISSVDLELRREYRGRCWAYDGTREGFRTAHCGRGSFFQVASDGTFSYQLPSALRPGRYVLDIKASDSAGNHTALARGSSRIVFYVR